MTIITERPTVHKKTGQITARSRESVGVYIFREWISHVWGESRVCWKGGGFFPGFRFRLEYIPDGVSHAVIWIDVMGENFH